MDNKEIINIKSLVESIFKHIENGNVINAFAPEKPEDYSNVYSLACDYYDKGLVEQAEKIFNSLCLYDFSNTDYLLGLAAVKQVQKQYRKAINLYAMVINLDGENVSAYLYSGQCFLSEGDIKTAVNHFRHILTLSCDPQDKQQAEYYLALVENKDG
ncbi:tetratricopeptide repeat protein [Morganella psychrotolerans]|uniref:Tetratricopeptide repeat protein n=1 Tax=Morganella psychrotolerans TaxID=368603 RepID=A0A5M9R5H5_9GAMM|nr:tetratricopeptide repeat protein [Morganella psychrotolerans]KAA8715432.1 tetratricopeptide repeat protein [Morganella psychrotolerans]OBU05478.1 hypothetical protein AYY16_09475 [Morganella psychrotolerans]